MAKSDRKPAPVAPSPPADPAPELMVTATGVTRRRYHRKTHAKYTGPSAKKTARNPKGCGRKAFVPTDEQRALVTVMVAGGIQHQHIATALGLSRPTLEKAFKHEIENAAAQANAKVIAALFKECCGGNIRAQEFWLTNRASSRWAHKQKVDGHVDMNVQLHDLVERARKKLKNND